ncbi:MAG: DUF362 domain-containing protein [Clostridia bacterium]|nr:DUF362 domain-containing protein [Clostridia bacterium]
MDTVYAAKCDGYEYEKVEKAVYKIFDGAGVAEKLSLKGKKVLLKVNLLLARKPEAAATTHPFVAASAAKYLISHGAAVTIADSPGGPYTPGALKRVYDACGMTAAAEMSGASLNFDVSQHSVKAELDGKTRAFELIAPVSECDVVISCAKAKTHSLTYFTGAAKNLFGTVAGLSKAAYHANYPQTADFAAAIVDLVRTVKPAFSIIDGVYGMEGNGPSGGTPKKAGFILGSENPFAADEEAMKLCGLDPDLAPIGRRARELGLLTDTSLAGDEIPVTRFQPALKGKRMWRALGVIPKKVSDRIGERLRPYPEISDRCVGCATCVNACPGKALTLTEGKAVLNKKKCIKCYCCHELCPVKAVDMR